MKESLQGRRLGFALRPVFGLLALGMALGVTLIDLGGWFAWGARDTNGFVWAGYWLAIAGAVLGLLALITALSELRDVPLEERSLARMDFALVVVTTLALAISAVLRSSDLGAAASAPAPLLLGLLGLLTALAGAVIGGSLYAPREWEEIVEEIHERPSRRRVTAR